MTDLVGLIDRASRWFADDVAVTDDDRDLSFREVGQRSNRLARALLALSPEPGGRVALLMPNRLEFVECDLAIIKAGKIKVPINERLSTEERVFILGDSGADTLILDPRHEEFAHQAARELDSLRNLVVLGEGRSTSAGYEDLLSAAGDTLPDVRPSGEDPSVILYTSGTTGRPKGATWTFAGRLSATMNMLAEELSVERGDAMVHAGSMAHGSGSKVLAYYLRGARNITVRRFDPPRFLKLVEDQRATGTFLVPTMIASLLEAAPGVDADLRSLKTISYGGAPISPRTVEAALDQFGDVLVQVYGSCEAPHPVTVLRASDHRVPAGKERRWESIGREVATTDVRLVAEDGVDASPGSAGEMWLRGPNLMRGYWNNEPATTEVLSGGWYRTGDVVTRDEDGFLYIVDRARDLIISGGLNIYPAEIEATLRDHEAVKDAAVIGIPDEHWGEAVVAFVVLHPGRDATVEQIVEHCRGHLAGYKKPRFVEFVGSLPKGATGKVQKRDLRAPYWAGRSRAVG